jgi:RHS repeat-associated protein
MDGETCVAVVRAGDAFPGAASPAVRFQLGDHLGSGLLVVDGAGGWVNREEFTPFGETSFGSFARKRFRFTGKERDAEHGLYYHGARYYAPWLLRWVGPDPAGGLDGLGLYVYVANNPVMFHDPQGLAKVPPSTIKKTGRIREKFWNGHFASRSDVAEVLPQPIYKDPDTKKTFLFPDEVKPQGKKRQADDLVKYKDGTVQPVEVSTARELASERKASQLKKDQFAIDNKIPAGSETKGYLTPNTPTHKAPGLPIVGEGGNVPPVRNLDAVADVGKKATKVAEAAGHLKTFAKRAGAAIPIIGIVVGQASVAQAATTGDYTGAALDEFGFVPVAGDLVDAGRAGYALGEAINVFLPDDVKDAIGGTIAETLENGVENVLDFYF